MIEEYEALMWWIRNTVNQSESKKNYVDEIIDLINSAKNGILIME